MRKTRRLWDAYRFPGFTPEPGVSGIFSDPKALVIKLVTENIIDKPNRIVIEGHTDSTPFKTAQKTNWELSTSRASAVRRELENNGIDSGRIARVVGYADQDLFNKDDPKDLRNRRISIILLQ
jgi:chemotaxis protein MotB